ncbi:MAG: dethiobiotin synthase [Candidatus Nitrohelix vancouverensis]|uniref:ATP-dependent dethiobiotin synthetase BioD n=1 Tax=Candidatus Nitrohelix vancouverensis TaxID=2705534 RepID=A0A7T0C4J5_9BACT|nr:MAG: dethiobiotin synthase [Candidatus Nitrohelix vancouverensis]
MTQQGFFITGTDTGSGKTAVTAGLLACFRNMGYKPGVMKPIETGVSPDCSSPANSDARFLMEANQETLALSQVCPYQIKTPAAPYQAARLDQREIDIGLILDAFSHIRETRNPMLVEGIGGLMVPICEDYSVVDLVRDTQLPLIVVSPLRLGALNHTLLTLKVAEMEGLLIAGVILNNLENRADDPVMAGMAELIQTFGKVPVLGQFPYLEELSSESIQENLSEIMNGLHLDTQTNWAFP